MACRKCHDLCIRFHLQQPSQLKKAIKIAAQNVEDRTISEVKGSGSIWQQPAFSELVAGGHWGDVLSYQFQCNSCGERFKLHAETYHGGGGYWEPINPRAAHANL
jgi:hypothetical protein